MTAGVRHPLLQVLIYGHVWLAFGVVSQVLWTGRFLHDAPDLWRYAIASGLGTIAAYGLMRWVRSREPMMKASVHLIWFRERSRAMLVLCVICCIGATILLWPPHWNVLRWLLPAGALAFLYVSPFTAKDGQSIGLRRVPMMKVLLIAAVWVIAVVAIPIEYDASDHQLFTIAATACMRMPLFMALAIAFDIRDTLFDPSSLRTAPQVFGVRGAKVLALLLLISSALFEHIFLRRLDYIASAWMVLIGYLFAAVLIAFASPKRGAFYFGILVDGVLLLIPICGWIGTRW